MHALRPTGRTIYFFGALGGLLFGYDTGVISGALLFIPNDFKLSPFLQGAIVAGLLLGAMIGAASAGRLADHLGRRRLIIIAAVVFTAGSLLAAFAPTVWVLIAARFIIGLAVGSAALVVPLYLSEIAPTEVRGAIASLNQLMIVLRHPRGVHRQRDPRLFGQLAPDAGTGRGSVDGSAGGDAVHARDAPVPRALRRGRNGARRPGGPARAMSSRASGSRRSARSTSRKRGTPGSRRCGTRNGCVQRYWSRPD